jgi:D-alanyl-D-alanine dipeptidase
MPSEFDDFTEKAALFYAGGSPEARGNRDLLVGAMRAEGFIPCDTEWWHYDDPEWAGFPIVDLRMDDLAP